MTREDEKEVRSILIRLMLVPLLLVAILAIGIKTAVAHSGSPALKTWTNGDTLTSTDLNNSFQHVDNGLSSITNSQISSTAAISHSKLATPALVPKAWAAMSTDCDTDGPCTVAAQSGVTSIERNGDDGGEIVPYLVRLTQTRPDINYAVTVGSMVTSAGYQCAGVPGSTSTVWVFCVNPSGVSAPGRFSVIVMDDN